MARHRKHDFEGDLNDPDYPEPPKEPLNDKVSKGDHVGDSSTSPIETW